MDDGTAVQLKLIREIRDALDGAGISWWLFGGWALDFHQGEITRPHSDIEVFVWAVDAQAVRAHSNVTASSHRRRCTPMKDSPSSRTARRSSGSFDGDRLCLDGLTVPAMSLDGGARHEDAVRRPRARRPAAREGIADIALLRKAIARRRSGNEPNPG